MEISRTVAASACALTVGGAIAESVHDAFATVDLESHISPVAGVSGGTVVYQVTTGAYPALDGRSPVDPGPARPAHYGGSVVR